jgi:hypothetical protein
MTVAEKRLVRKKVSAEVWSERVERWKSSGQTAKEFAAAEAVSAHSLSWWHWRLRRGSEEGSAGVKLRSRRSTKGERSMSFVPVVLRNGAEQAPLELILPGEIRVRVHPGFDEATLLRVIRVIGER